MRQAKMRLTESRKSSFHVRAEAQPSWDKISTDELADWKQRGPQTPLLDTVNFPVHIKNFNLRQLQQLCKELRAGEWCSACLSRCPVHRCRFNLI
jgi:hypothetical protein